MALGKAVRLYGMILLELEFMDWQSLKFLYEPEYCSDYTQPNHRQIQQIQFQLIYTATFFFSSAYRGSFFNASNTGYSRNIFMGAVRFSTH